MTAKTFIGSLAFVFVSKYTFNILYDSNKNVQTANLVSDSNNDNKPSIVNSGYLKPLVEQACKDDELYKVFTGQSQLNKKYAYLSTPFNRQIKDIYLVDDVEYKTFENYDFNKLSDFFLNIHIFVN